MFFTSDFEYRADSDAALALGTFDGVHVGHRAVVRTAVEAAKTENLVPAVWCFTASPKGEKSLVSVDEKREIMRSLGIELMVCPDFSNKIKAITAERFFYEVIVGKMRAKHVVCGFNYTFGKGGKGDTRLLRKLCAENGVELTVVPPVEVDGSVVSSTRIRELISACEFEKADTLLGR